MKATYWHVCSFSALDDLPAKLHRDSDAVEAAVKAAGRVSIFEVNARLATTLDSLERLGRLKRKAGGQHPWVLYEP